MWNLSMEEYAARPYGIVSVLVAIDGQFHPLPYCAVLQGVAAATKISELANSILDMGKAVMAKELKPIAHGVICGIAATGKASNNTRIMVAGE